MILNDSRLQVLASIVPVSLGQILKLSQLYLSAQHIANSRVTSIKSLPKAFSVVALVNHCWPIKYLQCTDRMWVNCKLQRQCPRMPLPPFLVPVPSLGHGNYRFGLAGTPSQPSAPKVTPSLDLSTTTSKTPVVLHSILDRARLLIFRSLSSILQTSSRFLGIESRFLHLDFNSHRRTSLVHLVCPRLLDRHNGCREHHLPQEPRRF